MYSVEKDIQFLESVLGKPLPEIDSIYFEGAKKWEKSDLRPTITPYFLSKLFTPEEMKMVICLPATPLEVAEKLDISEILNKYPYQISGGQKQRVASSRAIITNPKMVLADEPTGALDSKSARQLLETFEHLNKNLRATILMVTHDAFTASYADRIIFIKDGKIFNELVKGEDTRKQFFEKIIEVQTLLGGDLNDVI